MLKIRNVKLLRKLFRHFPLLVAKCEDSRMQSSKKGRKKLEAAVRLPIFATETTNDRQPVTV